MTVDETRDRMIRLETQYEHMAKTMEAMEAKVDAMHDILMQARGVRWLVLAMASVGGFLAAFAANHWPLWPGR